MSIVVQFTLHIGSRLELQRELQNIILPIVSLFLSLHTPSSTALCTLLLLFGSRSVWIFPCGLGALLLHGKNTCVQPGKASSFSQCFVFNEDNEHFQRHASRQHA